MLFRAKLSCSALGAGLVAALSPTALALQAPAPKGVAPGEPFGSLASTCFVANEGQWDAPARFRIGHGPVNGWVLDDGFVIDLRGERACALGFRFEGARAVTPRGTERADERRNFLGSGAHPDVACWHALRYDELLEGVDLALRPGLGLFEYDLELRPGAALERIAVAVEGADALAIAPDGALEVRCAAGVLRQSPPVAWTVGEDGAKRPVACSYRLLDAQRFGFVAPERAAGDVLVVDPGLEWGSFVGNYDYDLCYDVVRAANGDAIVVGTSSSPSFPATRGSYDAMLGGASDAFVARVAEDGRHLRFATFLGGSGSEVAYGVGLAPGGEIVVAGETGSPDFPVTAGAYDTSHNGAVDAFVAVLAPDGTSVVTATYLGALGDDRARDLWVDATGRATVTGVTNSGGFPTTLFAFDTSYNGGTGGGGDAFVARFAPNLTGLQYSTFLGGTANEVALGLAVDASDRATVVGVTGSGDFPVTSGAFDPSPNGSGFFQDAFVTRLAANGQSLVYSSFLGGTGNDAARGVALRPDGAAAVVGGTESTNFPTSANAYDATANGGEDAFVTLVAPDGGSLLLSSYVGGADLDRANAVAFDPNGVLIAAGNTRSAGFPVTPWAWDRSIADPPGSFTGDAFVLRMLSDGSLLYASFLGGRQEDEALALAPLPDGRVLVCGHTSSFDFPTPNGFDSGYDGSGVPDGFVVRLEFSRFPFAYGSPAPSSEGYVADVGASFASYAAGQHQVYIDLGVALSNGWLFHGSGPASIPFMGTTLCVAPPFVRHTPVHLDYFGAKTVNVPITAAMVGTTRWWQFWYLDPASPNGIAMSPGIEVTYYP